MGVKFYCGINDTKWNHHPVAPGAYACVSPVYGATARTRKENRIHIPDEVREVIQDSGAFCDGPGQRLDFRAALDRQVEHADKYGYAERITHRASYDLLIDEKWINGRRHKARWSEADAAEAVVETVAAAEFMSRNRNGIGLILSAQGVSATQYLDCVERIAPLLEAGDIFGLGGWCITGKMPRRILPVFFDTMKRIIPRAAELGVRRAHIWGVIYAPALSALLWVCNQHGIELSTDSAGPSVRPAFGEWGYAEWKDPDYIRPMPTERGLHRARHVALTRDWLSRLEESPAYKNNELAKFAAFCGG